MELFNILYLPTQFPTDYSNYSKEQPIIFRIYNLEIRIIIINISFYFY